MTPCSRSDPWCGQWRSSTRFFQQTLVTLGPLPGLARLHSELIFLEALFAFGSEHRIFSCACRGLRPTNGVFLLAPLTLSTGRQGPTFEFGRLAFALETHLLGSLDAGLEGLQIVERPGRLSRTQGRTLLKRSRSALIERQRRALSQGLIRKHLDRIDATVDKALSGHHIGEATRDHKAAIAGNPLAQQGIIRLISRQPRRLECSLRGLVIHRTRQIESREDQCGIDRHRLDSRSRT